MITDRIKRNPIDYFNIIRDADISVDPSYNAMKVIIGVRNRTDFIQPVVDSFKRAGAEHITIVEHAHELQHKDRCENLGVNYVGMRCGKDDMYSRSLAFNVGAIVAGNCEWLLTHDIDCMVQRHFMTNVLKNLITRQRSAVQTFNKRRVLYCDEELSSGLMYGSVSIDDINEYSKGVFTSQGKAPGGSICLTRELFFEIGGYDPELFYGYAPEDQMFWNKMSMFCDVASCDNPVTDIFHLHHEFMGGTNPELKDMIKIAGQFEKMTIPQKMEVIQLKQNILAQWR